MLLWNNLLSLKLTTRLDWLSVSAFTGIVVVSCLSYMSQNCRTQAHFFSNHSSAQSGIPFRKRAPLWFSLLVMACMAAASPAFANDDYTNDDYLVYTIQLNNGWAYDYTYAPYYTTNNPNFNGSNSIACAFTGWQALWFTHDPIDTTIYTNVSFWLNGGPTGGQTFDFYAQVGPGFTNANSVYVKAPTNKWEQFTFSLTSLGVA